MGTNDKETKNEETQKEENGFKLVGYKNLYLKIFLSFLFSISAALGALLVAFGYQDQPWILAISLLILHMLEMACALFCYAVGKTDALLKKKKITLLMAIFYLLLAFLVMLIILEAIAFWTPQGEPLSSFPFSS